MLIVRMYFIDKIYKRLLEAIALVLCSDRAELKRAGNGTNVPLRIPEVTNGYRSW